MKKREEIITKPQRLKDYALWYYFRYYPSKNKLKNKLILKTKNNLELVEEVYKTIERLFDDIPILENKIQTYIFKNKNKQYILNNLLAKGFNKEDIFIVLKKYTQEWESLLDKNYLIKKIEQLKNKWKSINYIKNKFIEQSEDREIVAQCINIVFWEDWESDILKNEIEKLKCKNLEQSKIIQKLLSKWFSYSSIKKFVQ